jgi:hypothetical protein
VGSTVFWDVTLSGKLILTQTSVNFTGLSGITDRLCGLVVRVLGYRFGGPGFDSQAIHDFPTKKKKKKKKGKQVVGLERGSLSLVSTTEELLDRKVAAPV